MRFGQACGQSDYRLVTAVQSVLSSGGTFKLVEIVEMAVPKLYGIAGSRAHRSLWAIEEVGIEYEHVAVSFMEDSKTAEYLAVNPNGKIPALVDGELTIFESMAINLYLAKHYGGDLYPADAAAEALTWQWSFWGISEIEPLQMQMMLHTFLLPEEKRNERLVASSAKQLARPLAVLDKALDGRDWLIGDAFSIADLNVSAVMLLLVSMLKFDCSDYPNVSRWVSACHSREALG